MNRMTRFATNALVLSILSWCPVAGATKPMIIPDATGWVIESAEYSGKIADQIARLEGMLTIRVIRDGWVEVPLAWYGVTITNAQLTNRSPHAYLRPRDGTYVFATTHKGTYKIKLEFSTRLIQDSQHEGVSFQIPQASFSTLSLLVPKKDVELRETERLYVERQTDRKSGGVKLTARLAAASHIDVRWATKPSTPVKVDPVLYGEVNTLAVLEEQLAHLTAIIDYRITQGEVRELMVRLPKTFGVLAVRGGGIEEWKSTEVDGHNLLKVTLNFSLKDTTYRLLIEGEEPLSQTQTSYQMPELTLPGVKQERGQLAVATTESLELAPGTTEGLTRIDVKELSQTLRDATVFPILFAFRYHQHPYQATLAVTRYEHLPVLNAIAEQGELITIVSRQGELMTRAAYVIRANKKQFLGVYLPQGATLWSCIVDGRSVKPVDGEKSQLLVPLSSATSTDRPVIVELVYFEQRPALERIGRMTFHGPVLDIPTTIANWMVYSPAQMKWLRMSGNLEEGRASSQFVDDPFGTVVLAAAFGGEETFSGIAGSKSKMDELVQKRRPHILRDLLTRGKEGERGDDYRQYNAQAGYAFDKSESDSISNGDLSLPSSSAESPAQPHASRVATLEEKDLKKMQESGILPLKIHLPKAGRLHHFNRLMSTNDALELEVIFVNVPSFWLPLLGVVVMMVTTGGLAVRRFRKA